MVSGWVPFATEVWVSCDSVIVFSGYLFTPFFVDNNQGIPPAPPPISKVELTILRLKGIL
ncbi:hypothetical protein OVS_03180 [Mycoplasma ovis str. Michigan]|uniref:Uncharacterized protein n=1 Tax=Mycoplasma ovis str. Michigan TaxID=1415773 RepID=A0ABM5P293_9MOLU|nr:hypothetical protein OVS_03180 [Mycoplasma ovis str. Michigan]